MNKNDTASVLVEINCETDFVAKDESFKAFAGAVANAALISDANDVESLGAVVIDGGATVEEARQELIVKIGENISVRRFVKMAAEGDTVSCYLHGARIGVLIRLSGGSDEMGRDIAMGLDISAKRKSTQAMDSNENLLIIGAFSP